MPLYHSPVNPEILNTLRRELWEESGITSDFLALTLSSCVIATLGLLMNSAAVIIGAMIIAPLMMPLRGLALGSLDGDRELVKRSLVTLGLGTMVAILISGLVGGIFQVPSTSFGSEILARTRPNLADLGVAIAAGGISGFAKIRPKLSDALAGTAISVALMPPLCVVGIGLSQRDFNASSGSFFLYLTNFIGITLACLLVFAWGGYYLDLRKVGRAVFGFAVMAGVLGLPLFLSLYRLIQQERLEAAIKEQLQTETITIGQETELVNMRVFWNPVPWQNKIPLIILTLQTDKPITSTQVKFVQDFLAKRFGRRFKLVLRVSEVKRITADEKTRIETPAVEPPFMDTISPFPSHPTQ